MNLPIDVIPNVSPPQFRWRQTIDGLGGKRVVEHSGLLPSTVECAVADLIGIAKQLAAENAKLRAAHEAKLQPVPQVQAEAPGPEDTPVRVLPSGAPSQASDKRRPAAPARR